MTEENIKKLYACQERENKEVFYASMLSKNGSLADMRTSTEVKKGMHLMLMPIAEGWNGEIISADQILKSDEAFEATVMRVQGRGSFQIRIISLDELDKINRIRTGKAGLSNLESEIVTAGMIATIKLAGRMDINSSAHVQAVIKKVPEKYKLILFDVTKISILGHSAVAMLMMLLKEELKDRRFSFLVKAGTEVEDSLLESKISLLGSVFSDRDVAITFLLKESLD